MANRIEVPNTDDPRILRHVSIEGARLLTWDTGETSETGHHNVAYALWPDSHSAVLFTGRIGIPRGETIDGNESLRGVLVFCTLKPGDTDKEYFADYTADQLDWCTDDQAERINLHLYDLAEGQVPLPFENLMY